MKSGNSTRNFAAAVILVIEDPSKEILMYYHQLAMDQRELDTIFESDGDSIAP